MTRARVAAIVALLGVVAFVVIIVSGGGGGYVVRAELRDAGGLRKGFTVRMHGVPVGTITSTRLSAGDVAVVQARIEKSAGPVGRGARATVRAANVLGEKYLDITPGDLSHPARSGVVIPPSHTGVAVELDDVIDALDVPTQAALHAILGESGTALAGRGHDLASLLDVLPHSLQRLGQVLGQLGADNRTLGRLVDSSDRIVGAAAGQRRYLGRLVDGAAGTLDALASRQQDLGATIRRAPGTLSALRRALTALDGAAAPLGPAARGLRATAPQLTSVLQALPSFSHAAIPTLDTARGVAPALGRLGVQGTPLVQRLRPLAAELRTFATGVDPATSALDHSIDDVLGMVEGWARSTAPHDGASHVFRAGLTVGSDLFQALLAGSPPLAQHERQDAKPSASAPAAPSPSSPVQALPKVQLPKVQLPKVQLPDPGATGATVTSLLTYLLK